MDYELPPKRVEGESFEDNLTDNVEHGVFPERYCHNGETPSEVVDRVAKNVALAEAVYHDEEVTVHVSDLKPSHPRRHELAEDVWHDVSFRTEDGELQYLSGDGDWYDVEESSITAPLTERNASKFAYSTVVEQAPDSVGEEMEETAEQFRDIMTELSFIPNSPTLMNAGHELQQLSACFVDSPGDDLTNIHQTAKEAAEVFQSGGGMGYGFWDLRPYGDSVGSSDGIASGPITFMRTFDQMCETIAQGGARRGAQMGVMRISHPDAIEFIHSKNKDVSLAVSLRLNDPDDFTHNTFGEALDEARDIIETQSDENGQLPPMFRNAVEGHLSNFNISVGVTDNFMEALRNGEEFTFTNPRTGEPHIASEYTEEMYARYGLDHHVEPGEELTIPADELWDRIIDGAHENGEPGVVFLERMNKDHSFDVEEHPDKRIKATNPCLTGEMEVQLADGTTRAIGDLADVDESVEVRTLDGGEVTTRQATAFKTKEDTDIVRVTAGGEEIRVTPDHKIRSGIGDWVEAADLDVGDEIVTLSRARATPQGPVQETETVVVTAIEADGTADVYDLTVEDTHNFFASASGEASINVHNCGEQPLMEYEACNLGHINLSTLVAEDRVLWEDFREENIASSEEYEMGEDEVEDFVADFLDQAIDWEEFERRIEVGTRFLENVVTMSDFPVDKIEETVRDHRKIGLGVMGLGELFPQLGIRYGSGVGNEIAGCLSEFINQKSKEVSCGLAKERGSFVEWRRSKWANPTDYPEWFERQTGEKPEDWEDGFPIRNHNTTTVAPTGTTSMVGNTESGIEPIYSVANFKNVSDDVQGDEMLVQYNDYFLRTLEANGIDQEEVKDEAKRQMDNNEFQGIEGINAVPNELMSVFVTTSELSPEEHVRIQAAWQENVDSAISKTVNAPNDHTTEEAKDAFELAYELGCKGVTYYRDGSRSKQVLTTRQDNKLVDEATAEEVVDDVAERASEDSDFAEMLSAALEGIPEFDHEIAIESSIDGEFWYDNGHYAQKRERPENLIGCTQRVPTGYGKMYVTVNVDRQGRPFELFIKKGDSGGYENGFCEALGETISVGLRSGVDPEEIYDNLIGTKAPEVGFGGENFGTVQSIPEGVGKALKRVHEGEAEVGGTPIREILEKSGGSTEGMKITDGGTKSETPTNDAPTGLNMDTGSDGEPSLAPGEDCFCDDPMERRIVYEEGCKSCRSCGWSKCG